MASISVFDVLGPNMIGPSSSHTAGADSLAFLAQKMINGPLRKVVFTLYGSFAKTYRGHGTDRALLGGILGFNTDDRRIPDSFRIASERGLEYQFIPNEAAEVSHPNTVDISMTNAAGQTMTVRGESLGGGKIRISRINQVDVDFTGEYSTVIAIHKDTPGVVAHITSCLASENINIAFMKLFREEKGQTAYSIVESDDALPDSVSELIRKNPSVQDVMLVHKDQPVLTADADSSSPEESDCLEPVDFKNARELLALCEKNNCRISDIMYQREVCQSGLSGQEIRSRMRKAWKIMEESATVPITSPRKSIGGLIGGESKLLNLQLQAGKNICGNVVSRGIMHAMAVLEVNTSMGLIVAAPTAGSAGILPGVLLALKEEYGFSEEQILDAMFHAGAIGYLAMRNATIAGAVGGCQAEVGVASAMAASAAAELMGGTPSQCLSAGSTVLMNMLGLVCDPVGGLVEYPCQMRNASGVSNAFIAAELALAGVSQLIPFDEMLESMYTVGRALPRELRETAMGGCAVTPTGCQYTGCTGCGHQ